MQNRLGLDHDESSEAPSELPTDSSCLSEAVVCARDHRPDDQAIAAPAVVEDGDTDALTPAADSTAYDHSQLECLLTTYPPVLEALLLNLPTLSILNLYHTSRHLRSFLGSYPLAWSNLSFRTLPPQPSFLQPNSGTESPDGHGQNKKAHAMDFLCRYLIPHDAILTKLDLDNTSVSGAALRSRILEPKRATLAHLSVRGCKEVSLKYHILPFLHEEKSTPLDLVQNRPLALKSLYVYRCRHHRRRPYFPASLNRKDSDSKPTHELIELCHELGIWTDTAWCPSPGFRCFRRRDYYSARSAVSPPEVWVPFDRLWRSQNFVGVSSIGYPPGVVSKSCQQDRERAFGPSGGRLWEEDEYGHMGEGLGAKDFVRGEGKTVPTHLRKSHTTFVENFFCDSCEEPIHERCEQCSVRMHCMGCRKTLCASCAFDRPLPKRRRTPNESRDEPRSRNRRRDQKLHDRYWWAPGARRSPNLMNENPIIGEEGSSDEEDHAPTDPHPTAPGPGRQPKLEMTWCCLEPGFSGGGGIAFVGSHCGDHIRTSPLPKRRQYQGPAFRDVTPDSTSDVEETANTLGSGSSGSAETLPSRPVEEFDVFPYLEQDTNPESAAFQRWTSPRSLCKSCYESPQWKIPCTACRTAICIDHDIKTLKARRCGFRRLPAEREIIQERKKHLRDKKEYKKDQMLRGMNTFYAKWRPIISRMLEDSHVRNLGQARISSSGSEPKATDAATGTLNSLIDPVSPALQQSLQIAQAPAVTQSLDTAISTRPRSRSFSSDSPLPPAERRDSDFATLASEDRESVQLEETTNTTTDEQEVAISESSSVTHSQSPASSNASSTVTVTPLATRSRHSDPTTKSGVGTDDQAGSSSATAKQSPRHWTGCYSYFCPAPRDPNDRRHACTFSALQTCQLCNIMVCAPCAASHPQCTCSICSTSFLCPNCATSPAVQARCRFEAEETERIKREEHEEMKAKIARAAVKQQWLATESERQKADEVAEGLSEFLGCLEILD